MSDYNEIRTFMNKFKTNTEKYTHTSQMQPFLGKYNVERPDLEEFWTYYCDKVYSEGENFMSGLSEKPGAYMPVLADIDIQISAEDDVEYTKILYTSEQLKSVVQIYIDILKYIIKDFEYDNLVCFVLEKKNCYVNGPVVKSGFHLHFPFLFMSAIDQDIHLIPRIVKEVENRELFKNLIQHSGDVIDKGVIKKHWLMYGSRKDMKKEAYKLTKIFNYDGNEISLEKAMKSHSIFDANEDIIQLFQTSSSNLNSTKQNSTKPLDYYLPRILSVNSLNRPIFSVREGIEVIVKQKMIKVKEIKGIVENVPIAEAVEISKRLTDCLSIKRASDYDSWIEVGWILYNIGEGCLESLDIWINFSKKTTRGNFNEAYCVHEWNKMYKSNYTLGSLKHYAAMDSPEGYGKFLLDEKNKRIKDSLNGGHYDLARQLYDVYGQTHVCASLEKDLWFEYKNHRWSRDEKGMELKRKIAACLIPRYKDAAKQKIDEIDVIDEDNQETLSTVVEDNGRVTGSIKKIQSLIGSLNTSGFKASVMKECQELFFNNEFFKKLDDNPYLLGFNNGVLDLKTCSFRPGKPEDYISYTTGYDYKEYNSDDIEIQDIEHNLEKIFVDPILREYFVTYAATLLRGGNFQKTFVVMSGEGDNGKSVIIEIIEKALGDYCIKFPTTLLTGKRAQSSAANPELDRVHGRRFAVMQEPDGKDVINAGMLKELTGNDSMYVRGLFKDGREIRIMFKLALICNKLPRLSADDQATWNRVRVLTFESCFPKDQSLVPKSYEEQKEKKMFPRDNDFTEKIPHMRAPFLWYILQRYKSLRNIKLSELVDPPKVTEATRAYRENNDYYLQFINENIKKDFSPENNGLTLTEVYNTFIEWFKNTYTNSKCPNKIELREDLNRRWGNLIGGKWKNVRFRTLLDEEEEEKCAVYKSE
jgi:P4 family phage/plasmid primase-like protien